MRPITLLLVLPLMLAGCQKDDVSSKSVSVPVTKTDKDTSYVIGTTAKISNQDYSEGRRGQVLVPAERGDDTGNRGPVLTGIVQLTDGSDVHCQKYRSTIWSSFDAFEDLDMQCETELELDKVKAVVITG